MNKRRKLVIALGAGALAMPFGAFAQQQGKVWRVGFLSPRSRPTSSTPDVYGAFMQEMGKLGYVEGKNLVIEWRFAEGKYERLASLAAELVQSRVDVIVTGNTPSAIAAQQATTIIPIVMAGVGDPVGSGLVASLRRPGGNRTALSILALEISVKYLELLRAAVPKLTHVAVLMNPNQTIHASYLANVQAAAKITGVKVAPVEAGTASQIETAFGAMTRTRAGALIVQADSFFIVQRSQIAELAIKNLLPTIFAYRENVEAGGLMSYGENIAEHFRRAAMYVDKILKGAKPGDLPVQQPTKFELVINAKTAKALGISVTNELLLRADKVIK